MMVAYYNEIDPFAAQWLRELIKKGLIADGEVDERSIVDIRPADLVGYTQCHFFAGIGVWSYALRRAGWPDERPVWTGSCPCQPFSAAGKGDGFADERHLWPHFHWLIQNCRPAVVFGEQVASKDGLGWFDLVQADLEGSGYASGAVDTCAAGFGAPHIRQRLYWVAYANSNEQRQGRGAGSTAGERLWPELSGCNIDCRMDNSLSIGRIASGNGYNGQHDGQQLASNGSNDFGLVDPRSRRGETGLSEPIERQEGNAGEHDDSSRQLTGREAAPPPSRTRPTNGFWRDADWLFCRDGKWRPVEPGTFPLAHGATARVGRLRGYGNAIVAEQAAAFVEVAMEIL